jgi:hypothetical protein
MGEPGVDRWSVEPVALKTLKGLNQSNSYILSANIQDLFAPIDDSGIVACLDCSAKQRALQTQDSDASMQGALNPPDHNLIVSS